MDCALANGVRVSAWTFDELYGRDGKFLDGVSSRGQVFVGEIPSNFHGWVCRPSIIRPGMKTPGKQGRPRCRPRVARRNPSCEVRNLAKYSPVFRDQAWQPYRIKETNKGPEVWEIKWAEFWRKSEAGLPTRRHCLIMMRNVLTGEVKYFLANRMPGERNPVTKKWITLRWLLRVALSRWSIESCFREAKEELGLDHYEVRGWRCVHRHFFVTALSHLFCARIRKEDDDPENDESRLTIERVRSAINCYLTTSNLPPSVQRTYWAEEQILHQYHQTRNSRARVSHRKTRIIRLLKLGIDVTRIKSCTDDAQPP